MSTEKTARSGIKWPVCTMLLVIGLGALGYFSYSKFLEERAAGPAAQAPAQISPGQITPAPGAVGPSAGGPPAGEPAYRTVIPFYFLIGFAVLMTAILGTILYLWWSLKDWEGGKKYGDEEPAGED
jgi:hypothetical protein